MQVPSTTSGELEAKNLGHPLISFLRQTNLPVAASIHERTPPTPSVRTLPSCTVGELLGPGKLPAGPVAGDAAYLSSQICLPVLASRQRVISSLSSRVKT